MFDAATPAAFEAVVRRALALKSDRDGWQAMMARGMALDLSWGRLALQYLDLYAQASAARQGVTDGLR